MNYSNKIELLAPVGSIDALNAAISEGADAVYLGTKDFNARLRAKNFAYKQLEAATDTLHLLGKKIYVTINTVVEEWELSRLYNLLKYLDAISVDGVIVQDLGLIKMINDYFPDLPIHASTQMNISTSQGVNYLSRFGVRRVVLSRELSFDEIKSITHNTNTEIEVFVHGALCVSASGLCLFSSFFGGKSANKGQCTQACRRSYISEAGDKKYYFSTKDLMLLQYIPDLVDAGIASLKIEGRMKSADYVGSVVRAYRYMIDNYQTNYDDALRHSQCLMASELSREKTTFLFDTTKIHADKPEFINMAQSGEQGIKVANISKVEKATDGYQIYCPQTSILEDGDYIRIHSKRTDRSNNYKITDLKSDTITSFIIPDKCDVKDEIYIFKKASETKKYKRLIPNNLDKFKKHPGIQPIPDRTGVKSLKNALNAKLPMGYYIQINKFAQFFLIQAFKPAKVIYSLNLNNSVELISNIRKVPFDIRDIIIELPAILTENNTVWLDETINTLTKFGIKYFIINNISELAYFKNNNAVILIGGQYLYTFNSFAIEFFIRSGIKFFIPPLEINKKNLFDSVKLFDKNIFIVNIFTFPVLFNINYGLTNYPDKLSDLKNNDFFIIREKKQTRVISDTPYSILDKVSYISKNNINRFIINLSDISLSKSDYKNLVKKLGLGANTDKFSRFNWKDGFFREKSKNPDEK